MTNPNLPYTDLPAQHGRQPVPGVRPVARDGDPRDARRRTATPDAWDARVVRTRQLSRAEAERHVGEWIAAGAVPLATDPPWTAWERVRPDSVTGRPRVQRLAVDGGDPGTVVNWSAPRPVGVDDEDHWLRILGARRASPPRQGPVPHEWTA